METRVFLKSLASDKSLYRQENTVVVKFMVAADDAKAVLDQILVLTGQSGQWTADMQMLDFPPQTSPTKAAYKLAEWMEKMAAAIRNADFDTIDLKSL